VAPLTPLSSEYRVAWWRPTLVHPTPPSQGMAFPAFALMHYLHVFHARDYRLLLIWAGETLAHRTCVFPPDFRFPFMAQTDLQLGYTFTDPAHRGKGLATFAIGEAVRALAQPGRKFWYLVDAENVPSVKAIERAGFTLAGEGRKHARLGLNLLGSYRMDAN
jgi:GNAT superfamily N-acetyltransferase